MKVTISTIALLAALASPAAAFNIGGGSNANSNATAIAGANQQQGQAQGQVQGQGQSQSVNNSNTYNESDAVSSAVAPSIGGGGCNVGFGLGSSVETLGLSAGINWRNIPCAVMQEAAQLDAMGYTKAAITHLALHHKRMGKTLRHSGAVVDAPAPVTSTRSTPATAPVVSYTSCKMDGGAIRVGVKRGASEDVRARAIADCRATLR